MKKDLKIVDHLFRHQFGKMVAILVRLFGFKAIETAEDIVQESFLKALSIWKLNGLPDNPEAWLIRVAKNLAIDQLRKNKVHSKYLDLNAHSGIASISIDNLFHEKELKDAQLRMIFACCHPSLSSSVQIALTLQVVSGFSIQEVANALLLNKDQVKKRIQRAKSKLKSENQELNIPVGKELIKRLPVVEKIIYLIFNEGYYSSNTDKIIREELCFEAMRLAKLLVGNPFLRHPDIYALLGLMCFHACRLPSRTSAKSEIILFEEQDRGQWIQELIILGNQFMYQAVKTKEFSTYHYQAAIAAEYVKPNRFEDTNWEKILEWYEALLLIDESPIFLMSRVVVYIYNNQFEFAERELTNLHKAVPENKSFMLDAIWATYYEKQGDIYKAKDYLLSAFKKAPTKMEEKVFVHRLDQLKF